MAKWVTFLAPTVILWWLSGHGGSGGGTSSRYASAGLRKAVLDAWEKKGYPRQEASFAVSTESGWRTNAFNPRGGAAGLVQFEPSVLRAFGWHGTSREFANASEAVQEPYYLRFIARLPTWGVPGDARLALFLPAFIRTPDDFVLAAKGGPRENVWRANPGLRVGSSAGHVTQNPITSGSVRATVA